ncbi:MAG: hypothetical protein ACI883_001638, partial [Candidatus Azotimanducaceae bacterium]
MPSAKKKCPNARLNSELKLEEANYAKYVMSLPINSISIKRS